MSKNVVEECVSGQCCCRLIINKCNEKSTPTEVVKSQNERGEHTKNSEMILCDFLKLQPVSDFIKALQDNGAKTKESKDKQHSTNEPIKIPGSVNRICHQPSTADHGEKYPQHRNQEIKQNPQVQPAYGVSEDRVMSQIIINIGTIKTDRVCKRDSCQQTDPEVQTTVSPPTSQPTSVCPPIKKQTSVCPPVERLTSICPPTEKPTSIYPPAKRQTSICPSTEKTTSVCSPAKRPAAVISTKVRPPVIESISVARDRSCRYQNKAPSTAPSLELKPGVKSEIKWKMNCCCTCHSDVC